jgi:hypothetical protein
MNPTLIYKLVGTDSINLDDEAVPDYKVVIVPIRHAEGYTLTRLSVYPSNNATCEQIARRINRVSQKHDTVIHNIVHVGILTSILKNHTVLQYLVMMQRTSLQHYKVL